MSTENVDGDTPGGRRRRGATDAEVRKRIEGLDQQIEAIGKTARDRHSRTLSLTIDDEQFEWCDTADACIECGALAVFSVDFIGPPATSLPSYVCDECGAEFN